MRKWNWFQWVLFASIIGILSLWVSAGWLFPKGEAFQTDEFVWSEYHGRGYVWDTEPSPESNPAWVRFIHDNDGVGLFALFSCLGLGLWITTISRRRHDKLFSGAFGDLNACHRGADFVSWYYRWKEKGLSEDELINSFPDKSIPAALKRELERQGKIVRVAPPSHYD